MSLYREARSGRRRLALAGGVALAAVAAVAVAVAVALGGEESDADRLARLQDDVQPALAALELIPIHYGSANPTTHAAAADQLQVAQQTVEDVEDDLRRRDEAAAERVLEELEQLERLVRTTGRSGAVEDAARETADDIRGLVGLAPGRS